MPSNLVPTRGPMFRGNVNTKLDSKGRILLGARFKDGLGAKAIIAKGNGPFLMVFPVDEFNKLEARLMPLMDLGTDSGLRNFMTGKFQAYLTNFYSNQSEVDVDEQARISVPKFIRDEMDLAGDLVVLSTGKYLQIWKKKTYYQRQEDEIDFDPSEILGRAGNRE